MRNTAPPFSALAQHEVFAVDERSAQLLVRSATDSVVIRFGDRSVSAPTTRGVAVVELDDLSPDTNFTATLHDEHTSLGELQFRTRPSIGPILSRFATISDVHLGAESFSGARSLVDPCYADPYALRCARSAVSELSAWGAELLVVKGDLTDTGRTSDWELAEVLFGDVDLPVIFSPGNHDVWKTRDLEPAEGSARIGIEIKDVLVRDLDGVRVVLVDTTRASRGTGDLARSKDAILEAIDTAQPVFLALHHNIQRAPVTWFWPAGISSANARPVVSALSSVNPRIFVSSGHTHRNRRHTLAGGITYTEVGATSDYPGVWAGYEVSETTIRQTVRRIAAPEALTWTELTRQALRTVWPRWSQGRLADRCVDVSFDR